MATEKGQIFFILLLSNLWMGAAVGAEIACGSVDGEFHRCALVGADRMKVKLKQRLDGDCKSGETWGVDSDGVWVDMGCRGLFRYTAPQLGVQRAGWRRFLPAWSR
jgi:hypothetical protein